MHRALFVSVIYLYSDYLTPYSYCSNAKLSKANGQEIWPSWSCLQAALAFGELAILCYKVSPPVQPLELSI